MFTGKENDDRGAKTCQQTISNDRGKMSSVMGYEATHRDTESAQEEGDTWQELRRNWNKCLLGFDYD
jgi:hypothetical protein